jgi:hypothetical protein
LEVCEFEVVEWALLVSEGWEKRHLRRVEVTSIPVIKHANSRSSAIFSGFVDLERECVVLALYRWDFWSGLVMRLVEL